MLPSQEVPDLRCCGSRRVRACATNRGESRGYMGLGMAQVLAHVLRTVVKMQEMPLQYHIAGGSDMRLLPSC